MGDMKQIIGSVFSCRRLLATGKKGETAMSEKTGKRLTIAALLAWIVLQLYTSFDIIVHGLCTVHYLARTVTTTGLWLLSLAALDALLYFYGGRRLLWELKWYWGTCGVLLAVLFLVGRLILFAVLVYGITPFPQMLLASYLLVEKGLGLPGKAADTTALVLTVALIAGHFLWLRRLERRVKGEAERTSA